MNVTQIQFWTEEYQGRLHEHFSLSVDQADMSQSYILKSATGLDPEEIIRQFYGTISVAQSRYFPKQRYYDFIPGPRVVAFKIRLNPNYAIGETPQSLRDRLYKMISYHRGGDVSIRFINGYTESARLSGYVTNVEADMFSREPTVTLTFKCDYPLLRKGPVTKYGLDPAFFVINDDPSTAPHGMNMILQINADTFGVGFKGMADADVASFGVAFAFLAGDQLYIKTEPDDRQVYFTRLGTKYNIMDRVISGSIWPTMFPDVNEFAVTIANTTMLDFNYYETYWGL
jgi:hypothetical protein